MKKKTERTVTFKAKHEYIRKLNALSRKIKIDQSKTLRLAIDDAYEKYVSSGGDRELYVLTEKELRTSDELRAVTRKLEDVYGWLSSHEFPGSEIELELPQIEQREEYKEILPEIREELRKTNRTRITIRELRALHKTVGLRRARAKLSGGQEGVK